MNLFKLNLVFVGFPIALCLLGIWDEVFLFWGLLSTILTGFFQVIIGFGMYFDEPNDNSLKVYVSLVISFFVIWIATAFIEDGLEIMRYMFALPPLLALYLTVIIYKKRNR